jgi:hypothetical protein
MARNPDPRYDEKSIRPDKFALDVVNWTWRFLVTRSTLTNAE